jgi:hypothetical protein
VLLLNEEFFADYRPVTPGHVTALVLALPELMPPHPHITAFRKLYPTFRTLTHYYCYSLIRSSEMAPLYPSVQAFYRPEPVRNAIVTQNPVMLSGPGDGFTKEEVENALDPLKTPFNPTREYLQCDIGSLTPGPQAVTFMGRVVNFTTQYGKSKSHAAATGWHHMIVKDDTGGICVNPPHSRQAHRVDMLSLTWLDLAGKALLYQ